MSNRCDVCTVHVHNILARYLIIINNINLVDDDDDTMATTMIKSNGMAHSYTKYKFNLALINI